ncbi:MAG: hypothetical protein M0R77_00970 [Gammaproteobacteria bacterium]|nr:hypothetical protein [Acholeplasmataceae bacterium]MCK9529127.1 hypothetical protein [Gammaproteobacteria bacterium]
MAFTTQFSIHTSPYLNPLDAKRQAFSVEADNRKEALKESLNKIIDELDDETIKQPSITLNIIYAEENDKEDFYVAYFDFKKDSYLDIKSSILIPHTFTTLAPEEIISIKFKKLSVKPSEQSLWVDEEGSMFISNYPNVYFNRNDLPVENFDYDFNVYYDLAMFKGLTNVESYNYEVPVLYQKRVDKAIAFTTRIKEAATLAQVPESVIKEVFG